MSKKNKLMLFLAFLLLIAGYFLFSQNIKPEPALVQAQTGPQIAGAPSSIQHKQSITISGAGFGTKSSAAPLKWDDFEAGMPGQVVGNGWYVWSSHGRKPLYANDTVRAGSAVSTKQDFTNGQYNCALALTGLSSHRYYVTHWRYVTRTGAKSRNMKPFALRATTSWDPQGATYGILDSLNTALIYTTPPDTGGPSTSDWCGPDFPLNSWNRFEYYFDRGTPNTPDGYFSYVRDGLLIAEIANKTIASSDWKYPVVFLNSYFATDEGSPTPSAYFWADDIYVDITRARVEIGNAATFASCTHREIQIPTAWSSGSITFTANQGSFNDGETAYLYVIDSEGNVNENGYPITIGTGTPDIIPPSAPTGVSVQ